MPNSNDKFDNQVPSSINTPNDDVVDVNLPAPKDALKNPRFSGASGGSMEIGDNDVTDGTNDISKSAKITLGNYLNAKTKGVNDYKIRPGSTPAVNKPRGGSLSSIPSNQDAFYVPGEGDNDVLQSSGLGLGGVKSSFFEKSQIDGILSKNHVDPSLSGDTLLKSIPSESISPRIVKVGAPSAGAPVGEGRGYDILKAIHKQLTDGNMYSSDGDLTDRQPFFKNDSGNEEQRTRGLFSIQRNLGHFDTDGKRVQVSDMSAMAIALMMRAADNDEASAEILNSSKLPNLSLSPLKIFLRAGQWGTAGVGIKDFRLSAISKATSERATKMALEATGQEDFGLSIGSSRSLRTRGIPPSNSPEIPEFQSSAMNATSYAQMNSFMEPFAAGTRFSSVGMFTMAAASFLAVITVGLIVSGLASIGGVGEITPPSRNAPPAFPMGRNRDDSAGAAILFRLLSITRTDFNFAACLGEGLKLLYGWRGGTPTPNEVSNPNSAIIIAESLVLSGGYYSNFTRRILSSVLNLANIFSKIGGSGITGGIEATLRGIEALLDSPAYKLIMIATGIGNISLKTQFGIVNESPAHEIFAGNSKASFKKEDYVKLANNRQAITRWGDRLNGLSLRTFLSSQKEIRFSDKSSNGVSLRFNEPNRETVKEIENRLESEFMPFYIHDLRTDEIVSLPAFITEFSESFNANYNAVKGIGRQDAVRLYQDTERTTTFGFMLVSFNPEDHDHMWLVVNKLVAMCYPQYSAGRIRTANGKKIVQPFSQVPTASPMVRLRLGDVFKSNYSRFGLARLFGARSSVLDQTVTNEEEYKDLVIKELTKAIEIGRGYETALADVRSDAIAIGFKTDDSKDLIKSLTVDVVQKAIPLGSEVLVEPESIIADPKTGKAMVFEKGKRKVWKFSQTQFLAKVTGYFKIPENEKSSPGGPGGMQLKLEIDTTEVKELPKDIAISLAMVSGFSNRWLSEQVNKNSDIDAIRKKLRAARADFPKTDFYDDRTNAIVRSFESTRGRGVAGFITSISLDYGMGSYLWDDRIVGSKAPMMVKITMGFAPITDLPLGLDYDGNIRNPSHPVGKIAGSFGDPWYGLSSSDPENAKPMDKESIVKAIAANAPVTPQPAAQPVQPAPTPPPPAPAPPTPAPTPPPTPTR